MLILSFLTLLVLVVVVGEISVSSAVDRSLADREIESVQLEYAARGALHVAKALLLRDLAVAPPVMGAEGTDSLHDVWADPSLTTVNFGNVTARIEITDEGKRPAHELNRTGRFGEKAYRDSAAGIRRRGLRRGAAPSGRG